MCLCHRHPLLLDLWGAVHKIMAPELEGRVLDQLNEGDEQTPRVGPVHNQPLQQDPKRHHHLLANRQVLKSTLKQR